MPVSLPILTSRSHHALFGGQPLLFRAALRSQGSTPEKALTSYFSQLRQETSQWFRSQYQNTLSDMDNAFARQYNQMAQPKVNANPSSSIALLPMAATFMNHQAEQLPLKTHDRAITNHNTSDRVYNL